MRICDYTARIYSYSYGVNIDLSNGLLSKCVLEDGILIIMMDSKVCSSVLGLLTSMHAVSMHCVIQTIICAFVITDVLEGMTCVANYINEMQRVSESYCSLFTLILSENTPILQVSATPF